MHGPSSGEAWRRITAIRGLAVAAGKPEREMLRASDGAGSHEPEEDRGPEAGGHKAKPGDDHAFADEVPEIRADHEQEHERDDDRGDRRVSKVKECERDDWKERRQEGATPWTSALRIAANWKASLCSSLSRASIARSMVRMSSFFSTRSAS